MEFSALDLTFDVCIMSALLVLGKIIRTRVPLLQNLFIPSALIAGFIGIILGPFCLNWVPLSSQASSYAGILIAVLFATLYLGRRSQGSFKEMFRQVGDTFMLNGAAEILQYGIALILGGILIATVFQGVTEWFPILMPGGFVGGHGTAAAIGSVFEEGGWAEATTVGQTFATFGLLGGIISGIIATHEAYVSDSGLKLIYEVERGVRVRGDADMIRQATANLISNAVRYTPEGGHITVSVKKGDIMAMENGKIVNIGTDIAKMTYRLARSMVKKDTSFITLIAGADVTEEAANAAAAAIAEKAGNRIEVTVVPGGQPVYYYFLSLE